MAETVADLKDELRERKEGGSAMRWALQACGSVLLCVAVVVGFLFVKRVKEQTGDTKGKRKPKPLAGKPLGPTSREAERNRRDAEQERKREAAAARERDLEARLDAADQHVEEAVQGFKKCKTVMNSVAFEVVCPITQELPIDPVLAEDGKIYERTAIKTWLGKNKRSPSTGAAMGTRLLPAVQVRSMIEQLVKSGAVDKDKAAAWTKKLGDETKVKEWKSKAERGDAQAMWNLACAYYFGKRGLALDVKQARAWIQRAADLGHVGSMATLGHYLWTGTGGEQNNPLGLYHTTSAAWLGSDMAAFNLGFAFKKGLYGLPVDVKQARFWFTQIAEGKCMVLHGQQRILNDAKKFLLEMA